MDGQGFASIGGLLQMIRKIESKGFYIDECRLPGESKADDRVPAQHNTIQLSRDRWFVVYETRGFRGVDDNCSVVYQIRRDTPDGVVLTEGYLDPSIDDWDPVGNGGRFVRQGNHSIAFGVPKGALFEGHRVPHENVFVVAWGNHARALDPESGYLWARSEMGVPPGTSRCTWAQFRLNDEEDDIELLQQKTALRQKGYEEGEALCSHEELRSMNHSFVAPVPYNEDGSEWAHMQHWEGVCLPVRYRWNPETGLYEWVESGPQLKGPSGARIGEGSIVPYRGEWLAAARMGGKDFGIVWFRCSDLFGSEPTPIFSDAVGSNCPRTVYGFPDGVVRLFTTDQRNSPYQDIYQRRIPLNLLDIDPDHGFAVTRSHIVFDSIKEGLPIPKKHAPTMHFGRLLPHGGGSTGLASFFVRTRAILPRAYTMGNYKGIATRPEIEASGVYYCELTYDQELPPTWTFETVS
ncbi:MAG: hypothetical protein DRP71_11220 [Verrucomicrobia bacterium]|nr:MAG: hypothetical protein DRP71_11220 [Verrucomicrobiota bacterium]